MPTSHYAHLRGLLQVLCAGVLVGYGCTGRCSCCASRIDLPARGHHLASTIGAAVALLLLVALRRVGELASLVRRHPWRLLAVGTGTASFQTLFFLAVPMAGVAVATMVGLGVAPAPLTVYDAVGSRRAPSVGRVTVLATTLMGLVLVSVVAGEAGTGPRPVAGVLLAAISATIFAVTTVAVGGRISRACHRWCSPTVWRWWACSSSRRPCCWWTGPR